MSAITKALIYNAVLFLLIYGIVAIAEYSYHINEWSNFGIILFCSTFAMLSIGVNVKISIEDERIK